jgi:ABC-2 type transport system ATP-binding protein
MPPTTQTGPALLAEGLRKTFGATVALDGVDLRVERAQVLGLLGPNGAGKTTTVRVFTTLIRPDQGQALIDGIDVVAEPMRAKARIGLTGQYAAVDERLTGAENLEHVGRLFHMARAEARARGRDLLDRFDLVDAADRIVKGYSGGMRRRLDIAMSLIARPSVLFLDEPTTGLDPRSRQSVWQLISELVAGGTTTLLTTQYLDEADELADEIAVIDQGRVIARGTSDVLKQEAGGDRIEVTVADPADAGRVVEALAAGACGRPTVSGDDGQVISVPMLELDGKVPETVRRLDAVGVNVRDVAARRATLDDVFFSLTGHAAEQTINGEEAA